MNTFSLATRPLFACTLAMLTLVVSLNAQGQTVEKEYLVRTADASQVQTRASACAPATALRDLEWNNVRALVETAGTLWHERANWRGATSCRRRTTCPRCLRAPCGSAASVQTSN